MTSMAIMQRIKNMETSIARLESKVVAMKGEQNIQRHGLESVGTELGRCVKKPGRPAKPAAVDDRTNAQAEGG